MGNITTDVNKSTSKKRGVTTEFYRQVQQNPDKATALRNALLTTMKQHPNHKDWAALTLIGEAESYKIDFIFCANLS